MTTAPLTLAPKLSQHATRGYFMAGTAACLWAVNGTVSKVILASGVSSLRLAEVRVTGAFVGFGVIMLFTNPSRMRVTWRELPMLAFFGIAGLAAVQWFYFLAIHRLSIGIALLIQYLAPLLVALWARVAYHEHIRGRIWLALGLALLGLSLIVNVRHPGTLSTSGVVFAFFAAVTFALYIIVAEHSLGDRDPISLLTWGFGFAAVFAAIVAPWWSFPAGRVGANVSLLGHLDAYHLPVWLLMLWVVVLGTIIPFLLLVNALRYLPATRVGIIAMLEPVVATIVAWAWLDEVLGTGQLIGAAIVLTAIVLAQSAGSPVPHGSEIEASPPLH